jgi:PAS domain S-box-containing protein
MGAVVVEITDRKEAEEKLRESEETFRQLAENIGEVFWMTDPRSGQVVYVSPAYERIWGRSREELAASPAAWQDAIHPEDRARLLLKESTRLEEQGHDHVYRILHRDGSIRWIHDRTFPVRDPAGDIVRMAGIAQDITAQKLAEEDVENLLRKVKETNDQLRRLSRQVVSSQEEERRRLSRELHDQTGQALTALKILLKSIEQDLPPGLETLQARLGEALSVADVTLDQIRNVARGLRPPGLEQVGLNATLEGHCREFARQTRLAIDYCGVEVDVPDAVGICLYRVAQEALTNVVKHAEAHDVKVILRADSKDITLSIEDDGRGIARSQRSGLGLVGMRERLELLGGDLEVQRRETGGTRLRARIPRRYVA